MPSLLPSLNYQVIGVEGAPWVTFIPGIGNDATFWAAQAEHLASRFSVLMFDPWGHSDSPAPPQPCGFDTVLQGVIQLWDQLGIKCSSLVGLGFGGSTALALSLEYPDRVERVVACCCRPRQPDGRRDFWRDRQKVARAEGLEQLGNATVDRWLGKAFIDAHPDVDHRLREMIMRTSVEGYCAYVGAFIEMDFDARLEQISVPTLLIAAEHDHGGGPVADMEAMQARIPGSVISVVKDSGHIVNHEQPEVVNGLLEQFLGQ